MCLLPTPDAYLFSPFTRITIISVNDIYIILKNALLVRPSSDWAVAWSSTFTGAFRNADLEYDGSLYTSMTAVYAIGFVFFYLK
jgi:hypothetical protein